MTFNYNDAGRSKSKRPKQRADCTVRALAICTGLSYDDAFDILKEGGRKNGCGFDLEKYLRRTPVRKPYRPLYLVPHTDLLVGDTLYYFQAHKIGREPGAKRLYRISDFVKDHRQGQLIAATAKHIFAVVNGVVQDDVPTHYQQDRPVYAWLGIRKVYSDEILFMAYAMSKPKGWARPLCRPLGLVAAWDVNGALDRARGWYDDATRKGETVEVKRYDAS